MMVHEEKGRRAQETCQFPWASWPRLARVGYWHGGRLGLLVVWGLSDSLRVSRQWSVHRALGLVK